MGSFRFLFLEWSQCGNQISLLFPSNICSTVGTTAAVVVDVELSVVVRVVWWIFIWIIFDVLTSFGRTFCSTSASVFDLSIVSRTTIRETCFAFGSSSSTVVGYLQWVCNADCGEHQDESDGLHFCTVWRVSVEWLSGNGPYRLLYPWRHLEFFQAVGGGAGWCTTGPLHFKLGYHGERPWGHSPACLLVYEDTAYPDIHFRTFYLPRALTKTAMRKLSLRYNLLSHCAKYLSYSYS